MPGSSSNADTDRSGSVPSMQSLSVPQTRNQTKHPISQLPRPTLARDRIPLDHVQRPYTLALRYTENSLDKKKRNSLVMAALMMTQGGSLVRCPACAVCESEQFEPLSSSWWQWWSDRTLTRTHTERDRRRRNS